MVEIPSIPSDPDRYQKYVTEVAETARDELERVGGGEQVVMDVVESEVFGSGFDVALFILKNSDRQPDEWEPFRGDSSDRGICEAMAYKELLHDVEAELGEDWGYTHE